jgi:uncharacterized membrane protein
MFLNPEFFKYAFEIGCFLIFIICIYHSFFNYGFDKTLREFTAGFILSAGCENIGVLSGAYVYPGFHLYFFEIPLANPLSWVALVYVIMEINNRLFITKFQHYSLFVFLICFALVDGILALLLDLMMDPLATVYNWWIWVEPNQSKVIEGNVDPYNFSELTHMTTPDNWVYDFFKNYFNKSRYPTRWFGIPVINYISWFVFVFVFSFQFRWVELKIEGNNITKNLILWLFVLIDIPILSWLLISQNL